MKQILLVIVFFLNFNLYLSADDKGIWSQKKISNNACAIYQFPVDEKGDYTKRGQVVFFVIKESNAIYVRTDAGYPYGNKKIKVLIDESNFQFFPDGDSAWSERDDRTVIDAMKAGTDMTVVGFSSKGTETTDTYSLIGFTNAYNNLKESC